MGCAGCPGLRIHDTAFVHSVISLQGARWCGFLHVACGPEVVIIEEAKAEIPGVQSSPAAQFCFSQRRKVSQQVNSLAVDLARPVVENTNSSHAVISDE
jgi:hypothetical protein